ncbi:MAG TPA: tRNA uridine-5-carboxymethylaminomethyl(34) synthesis GTPase MnmE [Gammaproteobacteria bacterium]|nr:tRNA uridine-5-carboxymethylaminomethyl(34) synthesis GTPase MnmE [Gammaproteobacteria bacterium]
MKTLRDDTIAALATAPGAAAVAVIRLSGRDALSIARRVAGIDVQPRRAALCDLVGLDGERIDRGLVLVFPAPRSYTGEDVVELQVHGSPVVTDWLLETLYAHGARPAEPGEFTLRAFLNDKLDLAQAEAVADLIASGSRHAAQAALRSLSGRFSEAVDAAQAELTAQRVQVEAWLDFPDEEIDRDSATRIALGLDALLRRLERLVASAAEGRVLRDGLNVVIAGAPNAGKSSLMNRLAGHDAAIVTSVPGTTRDTLHEHLSLDGLPVHLVDTAGLREASDAVEAEGILRAQRALERADRVLWVSDAREELAQAIASARAEVPNEVPFSVLRNKIDLVGAPPRAFEAAQAPILEISALTGDGIDLVRAHLKTVAGFVPEAAGTFSARRRHVTALERATAHVRAARGEIYGALEIAAEELRGAQAALAELTGELSSDDLLGEIFSSFCIGK